MSHSIRLRGPWEFEVMGRWVRGEGGEWRLEREGLPAGGKVEMPGSFGAVLGEDFFGRVRLRRRFHAPTGLGEGSLVWLVVESVEGEAEVMVNGVAMGRIVGRSAAGEGGAVRTLDREADGALHAPYRLDVTAELLAQNLLEIVVTTERERVGGLGLVRLEIE